MKPMGVSESRQSVWLLPGVIFICALSLRLWHIGKPSFWIDEGFSIWMSSHSARAILKILETDTHPPLFYWFLHVLLHHGRREEFLRFPFAIFGAVNTVLVYLTTLKSFDRRAAFLAALLWGTSFLALDSETQARMYPMANCFSLLATLFFLESLRRPSAWKWALYAGAGILGLYTHYYTGLILAAHVVYLLARREWKLAGLLTGGFLAAFCPWLPMLAGQFHNVQQGHAAAFPARKMFTEFSLLLGSYYWLQDDFRDFVSNCAGFGTAAIATAFLWNSRVNEKLLFIYLFWIPALGILSVTALTIGHVFYFRYGALFAPYFYILSAAALSKIRPGIRAAVIAAFLWINLSLWGLFTTSAAHERQNFRAASRFLAPRFAAGDVVVFGNFMSAFPFWYYLPDQLEIRYFPGKYTFALIPKSKEHIFWIPVNGDTPLSYLNEVVRQSKRQWLVLCQENLVDPSEKVPRFFHSRKPVLSEAFPGLEKDQTIRVFLFDSSRVP